MSKRVEVVTVTQQVLADTDAEHPITDDGLALEIAEQCGCNRPKRRALRTLVKNIMQVRADIHSAVAGEPGWFMDHSYKETEVLLANDVAKRLRFLSRDQKQGIFRWLVSKVFPSARELLRKTDRHATAGRGDLPRDFRQQIELGIQHCRRIQFFYLVLDPYAKPFRKHDGKLYLITPYDCFFANETLYVIGSEETTGMVKTFRVDRMDNLVLTSLQGEPLWKYFPNDPQGGLADMKARMVDCFYGEKIILELMVRYTEKAMDILCDLAMDRLEVVSYDPDSNCSFVRFPVCRCITLTGWLLQNHEFFTVLRPQCVIDDMLRIGRAVCAKYDPSDPEEVLSRHGQTENVGKEMTCSDRICVLILKDPTVTIVEIAAKLEISSRTVEREMQYLREIGRVARVGGRKTGHWQVNE